MRQHDQNSIPCERAMTQGQEEAREALPWQRSHGTREN